MKLNKLLKYFFRFLILQITLTFFVIFYFDNFLIGSYKEGFDIIIFNLLEDRDRFYSIIPISYLKIDIYLSMFVFLFLIILYSTKFYTYVNELSFKEGKNTLDEFFSLYLLWTSCLFIFVVIFRFHSVSRIYLILLTFFIPIILVFLRNSEAFSTLLGRSPTSENYITFNLSNDSVFRKLRILSLRNPIENFSIDLVENQFEVMRVIADMNKKININLIVINFENHIELKKEVLDFLVKLNKKVLLVSKNEIIFETYFIFRTEKIADHNLIYFNNDIQYGSKYIIKRVIDILLSLTLIIISFPIFILLAIYITFIDGIPFLIKQERVGLHGKKFNMYKFRTMHKDAHLQRENLKNINERDNILFKIQNDPRLLKNANFIRKFSLDELPQFFNVIKGEMSIVGPRPLFEEDTLQYNSEYLRRLNVLPGITGLLQINERNATSFQTWYEYDLNYIENWSISLDLKIILKTPISLLSNKNSSGI